MKPFKESINIIRHMNGNIDRHCDRHCFLDEAKKSAEKTLLQQNLDKQQVGITFPPSVVNNKKKFCLDRRSLRCLQQSQPGANNNNCWLNDEVKLISPSTLKVMSNFNIFQVVNAYYVLIAKCRNHQLV